MGPFILGKEHGGNACKLEDIPDHLWVHKMFNIRQFKRCEIDDTRPQGLPLGIRITKSRASEYEIEQIPDWRTDDGKVRFQVQWKAYPEEVGTWEPIHHITCVGGKDSVREYAAAVNSDEIYLLIPKVYRLSTHSLRIENR
jgi:hypothetical protein